ncbi:MAG: NADH-quinone oxidoreductase subunit NuoE [Methylotetracoccus sp.]
MSVAASQPLNPQLIREIESEIAHYPEPTAASIEALKLVQRHHGWVSDEHLKAVASMLGMSPEALDSVATFYNLIYRRPVGRNVILCCDSVSCWLLGADQVREHLSARLGIGLGETTADGAYTLLPVVCLGACDRAPALLVNDELIGKVDAQVVDRLLESGPQSDGAGT